MVEGGGGELRPKISESGSVGFRADEIWKMVRMLGTAVFLRKPTGLETKSTYKYDMSYTSLLFYSYGDEGIRYRERQGEGDFGTGGWDGVREFVHKSVVCLCRFLPDTLPDIVTTKPPPPPKHW